MNKKMENRQVWFVTGASKGLGLTLVQQLLADGFSVAATSRNVADLQSAVNDPDGRFLPLAVDLKDQESVRQGIVKTVDTFGHIDIIVNNAGFGQVGGLEELSDEEVRESFDVNVFGSLNVIRHAMPFLRAQRSGHIFNIASIGGFTGSFPGFGIYCATKFAVVGFTEALAEEVKRFGVHVTAVQPGYFRTQFLSSGSLATPRHEIAEYREVRDVQALHQNEINGAQAGDPAKAADVMIRMTQVPNPPVHLFLGRDAYDLANAKIDMLRKNMEEWEEIATATAFEVA